MEETIEKALDNVLLLLEKNENILEYKEIEELAKLHPQMSELEEKLKKSNQEVVQFAHYGLENAAKNSTNVANHLQEDFEKSPLVAEYRSRLFEANELIQEIFSKIEERVNEDEREN